ncbi:hypothetical protein FBEOM_9150 [Fusarium beomiforme]|uniref:Uncharacterized protein n=1 Tax=Fusarium beomiforme TaxID=44412 RepID=A0A9P5AE78_9HYPO|nr:hypothetical protein FBEOM_9150 [Fusarium beomiforme]
MADSAPSTCLSSGTMSWDTDGYSSFLDGQKPELSSVPDAVPAEVFFDVLDYQSDFMIGASSMEKALMARQYQNMHDDRLKETKSTAAFCGHQEPHRISLMYLIVLSVLPQEKNDRKRPLLYEGRTDVTFDDFLGFLEGPLTSFMEELSALEIKEICHLSCLMFQLYDPVHEADIPSYEMLEKQAQRLLVLIAQKFQIKYLQTD